MKREEFELLDLIRQKKSYKKNDKILYSLIKSGYVKNNSITDKGKKVLMPYKVDNAVIMAAGESTRLLPYTIENPKGLLSIKGEVLIERQIRQILSAGITQIVIVVGYQKEKFYYLKNKFKGIEIVYNPYFNERNNLDSLIVAKSYLRNSYICSSDNYYAINPFKAYKYESSYATIYFNKQLPESYVLSDENNHIVKMLREQQSGDVMIGYAYWSKNFSKAFVRLAIKNRYSKRYSKLVWERLYKDNIKKMPKMFNDNFPNGSIFEFDSLKDVKDFDKKFIAKSEIIDNIVRILKCNRDDVGNFKLIKGGLTNITFSFTVNKKRYFYRHPGQGTEQIISRSHERICCEYAKKIHLDSSYIYMDAKRGFKISHFISKYRYPKASSVSDTKKVATLLKKLHNYNKKVDWSFEPISAAIKIQKKLKTKTLSEFRDNNRILASIQKFNDFSKRYKTRRCFCHCDSYFTNFLIANKNKMYLVDWEYAAMADPAVDIATYIMRAGWTVTKAIKFIKFYLGDNCTSEAIKHYLYYVVIISYYWIIWGLQRKENNAKTENISSGIKYKMLTRYLKHIQKNN